MAEPQPTLRTAMRHLASGVSVITSGTGLDRAGLTATSVTSLTLEPPCILACVNRRVSAWPVIRLTRRFAVNILADRHRELAARFAGVGGVRGAARFDGADWTEGTLGLPVLSDALSSIECELESAIEWHSHMILIGAVRGVRTGRGKPLIYSQGAYGGVQPIEAFG